MKYARFEDLPVWKAAARLFVNVDALCEHPELSRRGDLGNQLHRAALSISNNIAEGFETGTTEQLITYLYYARASAGEVRSLLTILPAMPRFADLKSQVSSLRSEAEAISRQLHGFAESLPNSGIRGVRYLTDDARDLAQRKARVAMLDGQMKAIVAEAQAKREEGKIAA